MKRKFLTIVTLGMIGLGGYIGYMTNYVNPVIAHEATIPRIMDVPQPTGFKLDINLNNGEVTCNSQEQNIEIKIERKDSIIYKTRVVTKEVEKRIKVREMPSMREKKQNLSELCNVKTNSHRIVD